MTRLQFSTGGIDEKARKGAVEAALGAHVRSVVDFTKDDPVAVEMSLRDIAGIHVARLDTSPLRLITPPDTAGRLYLSFTCAGGGIIDAAGDATTSKPGDANIMCRGRLMTTVVARPSSIISIAVPRDRLEPHLASADNMIPSTRLSPMAAGLLCSYAISLLDSPLTPNGGEADMFSRHLVDLVALTLGARADAPPAPQREGVRAARRRAIRTDIAANLSSPALSLTWIARRHGVSDAYLRSLFYEEGTSFSDHVRNSRLDTIHAQLSDPLQDGRNIAELALTAGFGDVSWFNHAFRRRFGMRPSDLRAIRLAGQASGMQATIA